MPGVFAWTGLVSAFQQAGFLECAGRSETRLIMRFEIKGGNIAKEKRTAG